MTAFNPERTIYGGSGTKAAELERTAQMFIEMQKQGQHIYFIISLFLDSGRDIDDLRTVQEHLLEQYRENGAANETA